MAHPAMSAMLGHGGSSPMPVTSWVSSSSKTYKTITTCPHEVKVSAILGVTIKVYGSSNLDLHEYIDAIDRTADKVVHNFNFLYPSNQPMVEFENRIKMLSRMKDSIPHRLEEYKRSTIAPRFVQADVSASCGAATHQLEHAIKRITTLAQGFEPILRVAYALQAVHAKLDELDRTGRAITEEEKEHGKQQIHAMQAMLRERAVTPPTVVSSQKIEDLYSRVFEADRRLSSVMYLQERIPVADDWNIATITY